MPAHPETDSARAPFGICLAVGAVVVVAATALAAAAGFHSVWARLAVVAAATAGVAVWVDNAGAAIATAGLCFLVFNGFLVNRYGELGWDGAASVRQLSVLGSAAGLGLAWRWLRQLLARAAVDRELEDMLNDNIRNNSDKREV